MSKPQTVADYFDPHNVEHVRAYNHLCKHGNWPTEFWIKISKLDSPPLTVVEITGKMAQAWLKHMLEQAPADWDPQEYAKPHTE